MNNFEDGHKLELPDPRGPGNICLATVMSVHELWISVRLDGCDANNDRWFICDDNQLHPVGYAARTQVNLSFNRAWVFDSCASFEHEKWREFILKAK